ncbi:MAG: replication-relaxation family protein [Chloroflexi bacterium]|nr:replication-relaxation family protein [Chloroflexota bacterium]
MTYRAQTLKLGRIVNTRRLLTLDDQDLQTHLYILGATRTGKTKFMENILRQIIVGQRHKGPGLLLLDPHGTLYNDLTRYLADRAIALKRPVLFIDPSRDDFVVPYNILRRRTSAAGRPAEPSVVARQVLRTMSYVWGEHGTQATPRFHRMASNLLLTLYIKGYTTNEAYHYLHAFNRDLRRALTEDIDLPTVAAHWEQVNAMTPRDFMEVVESTLNRFEPLVAQPLLTRMFGHPDRSLDLHRAIDEGWIILCNLSTKDSQIDEDDARLLGTLLLADLWATAEDRGKAAGRGIAAQRPFVVAIDEVQNFITPTIAQNLAEASGFGLRLILAHQYPGQLTDDPRHEKHGKLLLKSLLTNARNKVIFGGIGSDEDLTPLVEVMYRGALNPDEIKHTLYGTKVLDYRLDYERAYTQTTGTTSGGSASTGTASGTASMRSAGNVSGTTYDSGGNILGTSYSTPQMEAFTSSLQQSSGQTTNWADSDSSSVADVPMLKPILGKEITSVQFRDLNEQRYRAMATLFDQEQRQCVVRLVGMHEPVSIFAPFVDNGFSSEKSCELYIAESYANWPDLVLPAAEATHLVDQRRHAIEQYLENHKLPSRQPRLPRATIQVQPTMPHNTETSEHSDYVDGVELQPRDWELLADVYDSRFITIPHAAALHYGSHAVAKRRLSDLRKALVLGRTPGHFGYAHVDGKLQEVKLIYTFTKKALDLLVNRRDFRDAKGEQWDSLRKRFDLDSSLTIKHEVGVLNVKAALLPALKSQAHLRVEKFGVWPLAYVFKAPLDGRLKPQKPDGFIHVLEFTPGSDTPQDHYFYLEFDHQRTEDLDRILAKVKAYKHHRTKGGFVRWLGFSDASPDDHPFRVLFVIDTKDAVKRRDNICEKLADAGITTFTPVTTLAELVANPLGPIWTTPKAHREWVQADCAGAPTLVSLSPAFSTATPVPSS